MYHRLFKDKLVIGLESEQIVLCIGTFFHKALELQLTYDRNWYQYFSLITRWTRKVDHAGLELEVSLGPITFEINLYDSRHWYHDQNRHYLPGEEMRLHEERKAKREANPNKNLLDESYGEFSDAQE